MSSGVDRLRALADYASYGGAPILGFDHLFIKAHRRSSAHSIANAVKVAAKAVRDGVARRGRRGRRRAGLTRWRCCAARPRPPRRRERSWSAAGTSTRPISRASSRPCATWCGSRSRRRRTRSRRRASAALMRGLRESALEPRRRDPRLLPLRQPAADRPRHPAQARARRHRLRRHRLQEPAAAPDARQVPPPARAGRLQAHRAARRRAAPSRRRRASTCSATTGNRTR